MREIILATDLAQHLRKIRDLDKMTIGKRPCVCVRLYTCVCVCACVCACRHVCVLVGERTCDTYLFLVQVSIHA